MRLLFLITLLLTMAGEPAYAAANKNIVVSAAFKKTKNGLCAVDTRGKSHLVPSFARPGSKFSSNITSIVPACSAEEQKSFKKTAKSAFLSEKTGGRPQKTLWQLLVPAAIGCSVVGGVELFNYLTDNKTEAASVCIDCADQDKNNITFKVQKGLSHNHLSIAFWREKINQEVEQKLKKQAAVLQAELQNITKDKAGKLSKAQLEESHKKTKLLAQLHSYIRDPEKFAKDNPPPKKRRNKRTTQVYSSKEERTYNQGGAVIHSNRTQTVIRDTGTDIIVTVEGPGGQRITLEEGNDQIMFSLFGGTGYQVSKLPYKVGKRPPSDSLPDELKDMIDYDFKQIRADAYRKMPKNPTTLEYIQQLPTKSVVATLSMVENSFVAVLAAAGVASHTISGAVKMVKSMPKSSSAASNLVKGSARFVGGGSIGGAVGLYALVSAVGGFILCSDGVMYFRDDNPKTDL